MLLRIRPIAWLCVAPMEFGFDPLLSRSEPRSCFFMPVSAPRSTMPSRCSMPPQPDQLRCRHDRYDNGERATPLYGTGDAMEPSENSSMISRARACACAQGKPRSGSVILPDVTRMAALYQGDNTGSVVVVDEVQRKGGQLGVEFVRLPVHEPNDYA